MSKKDKVLREDLDRYCFNKALKDNGYDKYELSIDEEYKDGESRTNYCVFYYLKEGKDRLFKAHSITGILKQMEIELGTRMMEKCDFYIEKPEKKVEERSSNWY